MNSRLTRLASQLPTALRQAAFLVVAWFAGQTLLERVWADPYKLTLGYWLPGLAVLVVLYLLLTFLFTIAPRAAYYLLGSTLACHWIWLLFRHGLPSDPRSGIAVLVRFVPWTALAWPLFGLAVASFWRAASSANRLLVVLAGVVWSIALAIAWQFQHFALDVGLHPADPFGARLGWIAWTLVAPAPLVSGVLVLGVLATVQRTQRSVGS